MSLAQLASAVAQVSTILSQLDQQLPGLIELTADARKHAGGRFRDGEAKALLAVLDVADQYPSFFQSLAADDEGNDPKTFEVSLLRDRLQRIAALQPLMEQFEARAQELADTVMYLGELTKPVMLAAYQLAKPQAKHDPRIQTLLAPAINFYAAIAKAAAATRKSKKAAAAAPPATGPTSPKGG